MENNTSKLEVSKQFQCSKETLFNTWTAPEQLKQWWKPMGKQLADVNNNLTEGGEIRYTFEDESLLIDGKYEKVHDHDLLEYTWNWHLTSEPVQDAAYKLTIRFDGDENSSALSVTQTGFNNEESIHPHKQGWEQALQQLSEYVNNMGNNKEGSSNGKPPITGYNETPEQLKVAGG